LALSPEHQWGVREHEVGKDKLGTPNLPCNATEVGKRLQSTIARLVAYERWVHPIQQTKDCTDRNQMQLQVIEVTRVQVSIS
jgi:hypothetical protein